MTVSPFDHPLLSAILGDEETARQFSVEAELAAMLAFERALAEAEAAEGIIDQAAAAAIVPALATFSPDMAKLRAGVARDGVVVPELVRQLREAVGEPHGANVHFGATSQDVIDTALVLRLKPIVERFDRQLAELIERFAAMDARFGSKDADRHHAHAGGDPDPRRPTASHRGGSRCERHRQRLSEQSPRLLDRAVRRRRRHAGKARRQGAGAAQGRLPPGSASATRRNGRASATTSPSSPAGCRWSPAALGKFGQDIALMALDGKEIALSGGGGSSAMPHKHNPVIAEVLVALARFNATQLSGMHQALVHEQERSGAAWTLEWLLLPQMVVATAAALRLAIELTGRVESLGP